MKCFLISTEHLEDRLWFKDEEDFKSGMNFVAITKYELEVDVLAFILMSNHVHLVLSCSEEEAIVFANTLKKYYGQYYSRKYSSKELLRRNAIDVRPIPLGNEALERSIAYVQMNCVAANICSTPVNYPWGTGNCFFNPLTPNGTKVKELSIRTLKRILHSHKTLPGEAIIGDGGYVLPESYVNIRWVESAFKTPSRMNYFLNSSSKARRRIESSEGGLPAFRDQNIVAVLPDLCYSIFQKRKVAELSQNELGEIARQIRYRFSSDPHQIARVIGVSYDSAIKLLETVEL